jgi:hypothetical protein
LYAIGEIVLVVIGILIGLQINNLNTSKIESKNKEIEELQSSGYLCSLTTGTHTHFN